LKFLLYKLLSYFEIDETVVFSALIKLWGIFSGLITVWLILSKFSVSTQGYYYTFSSILGINLFFELGLGPVIQNYASHEWSNLKYNSTYKIIEGDPESLNRLSSIFKFGFKWFIISSFFFFLILILVGSFFLMSLKNQDQNWIAPWFLISFLSSCNYIFTPIWALLEGCNQVKKMYKFRFLQVVCNNLFLWFAIYFKLELWAISISTLISIITSILFLNKNYFYFLSQLINNKSQKINNRLKKDFLQLQVKSALNSFGNFFSYSFFTPIIIKFLGSSIAGKFGMTYSMISLIANFSTSILTPKLPSMAIYASQKNLLSLNNLFFKILKSAIFFIIILSFVFFIIININYFKDYRDRLLDDNLIFLLLISQIFQTIQIIFGSYMRAFKKEEVVFITLFQSFFVLISTYYFSKYYSLHQVTISYLFISVITTILVVFKWKKFTLYINKL
jgi:O-antigen/teichoic acid export membrane protein